MSKQIILYEDDALVVVHKPAGVDAQASAGFSQDMISILKNDMVARGQKNPYVGVVHRLDKTVEGLLVYGKSQKMTAALCEQIAKRQMHKCYCAAVHGVPDRGEKLLEDYLTVNRTTRNAEIVAAGNPGKNDKRMKDVKLCRLIYENVSGDAPLEYAAFKNKLAAAGYVYSGEAGCYVQANGCGTSAGGRETAVQQPVNALNPEQSAISACTPVSLVYIQLLTGRYHQIRAQLSHAGHPIVGDRRYGMTGNGSAPDRAFSFPALCAVSLSFTHPKTGKEMSFSLLS